MSRQQQRYYKQTLTDEGAFVNDVLVWRNPTPGQWINLNIQQRGGQVWVNGELVYDADTEQANEQPEVADDAPAPQAKPRPHADDHMKLLIIGRMSKWFLTLSNLIALWPIWSAERDSDRAILALACLCSLVHHAAEMRYYAPSLLYFSPRSRWWLWKGDQLGAVVATLGVGSWALVSEHWFLVSLALLFMLGSEGVMFTPLPLEKRIDLRTQLHVPWHALSLGWIAWLAVTVYAREERLYESLLALLFPV